MLGGIQHVWARHDPLDEEGAKQNRRRDTARDAESYGGDQIAATGGVIGSPGAEHSFHSTFAEAFFIRRALNRVGVCHPLCRAAADTWKYADVRAEGAALENQPPVAEGIFHAFHDTTQLSNLFPGNARSLDSQVDNLRDGKQSYGHGNESDAVPQKDRRP